MWWGIGVGGALLYLIFFPVLWIFGAFMRRPAAAAAL
jgi:hypothetical protein